MTLHPFPRRALARSLALLTVLGGVIPTVFAPAALARATTPRAQLTRPAAALAYTPREVHKVTLDELSIDGPALWTVGAGIPAPTPGPDAILAALAWTGTDSAHRLNLLLSDNGQQYSRKLTLNESSDFRPGLVMVNAQGATLPVVAWTGTDANHSLNVLYDAYGARRKLALAENSDTAPSLAFFAGQVWLAWRGTDPNHSLNIRAMGANGLTPGAKTILRQYPVLGRPSLIADARDKLLMVTWASSAAPHYINFAVSSDGASWRTPLAAPPPQTSHNGPAIFALNPPPPTGAPGYFWAWTGTDAAHSLNLATAERYTSWPGPITTFDEQCFAGPSMGYVGQPNQVLIAWTGTDAAHHLNAGLFQVAPTS
ncbi:MAG TPA: hypothetical protein VFY89_02395 [Ktedonobacterales bacterium]